MEFKYTFGQGSILGFVNPPQNRVYQRYILEQSWVRYGLDAQTEDDSVRVRSLNCGGTGLKRTSANYESRPRVESLSMLRYK